MPSYPAKRVLPLVYIYRERERVRESINCVTDQWPKDTHTDTGVIEISSATAELKSISISNGISQIAAEKTTGKLEVYQLK